MVSHAHLQDHGPADITLGVPVEIHHGTHLVSAEVAFAALAALIGDEGLRLLGATALHIIDPTKMPSAIHFSSAALRSPREDAVAVHLVACTTVA